MYQQISMHGFNLPQWVADNGGEAYLGMLESISELVQVAPPLPPHLPHYQRLP